ncbi:hypothetical protein CB0940_08133 [Cercospora beticola]|uniref:Uncharacterized protein n=1 Tax=Cercospora beticola TaxID=122368 RepID=A0A2G5HS09_CERBT|nr:hypothetical protein CB0940_08133 [Cercospora beticola]PIA95012.1 hypothetical protein CB0940_08133 [Cercospora beticola]WPB04699.1 hypothetical protein RHO25_009346 [Cercospora beticola]
MAWAFFRGVCDAGRTAWNAFNRPRPTTSTTSKKSSTNRVFRGRVQPIRKAPSGLRTRRPCREIEDYTHRLQQLIYGYDAFENSEGDLKSIQYSIATLMEMRRRSREQDEQQRYSERLGRLCNALDLTEDTIEGNLQNIQKTADDLVDSLEPDGPGDLPPRLPISLIDQLRRYDNAMETYISQRDGTSGVQIPVSSDVDGDESREHGEVGANLTSSKSALSIKRRVLQACRMKLTEELRKLCKQHAPTALQDETIVRQLRRGEPVSSEVAREPDAGSDMSRPEITEALIAEWEFAQAELTKWTECYWSYINMDTQKQQRAEHLASGLTIEETDIKMRTLTSTFFSRCQNIDNYYRDVQKRAMLAGLDPVAPEDSDNGVFAKHAEDDPAISISSYDNVAEAQVELWLHENDPGVEFGDVPVPSTAHVDCVSVHFGEGRSGYEMTGPPTRTRDSRIRAWQQKCEEARIIAQQDMERLR